MFCCCLCYKKGRKDDTGTNIIARLKQKMKNLKRRKINDDFKTIYAMVQLLKKSPHSIDFLKKIRINP
jgi:hypothetical protein